MKDVTIVVGALSPSQRRRRHVVDEAEKRTERDRGGVLAAELTQDLSAVRPSRKATKKVARQAHCACGIEFKVPGSRFKGDGDSESGLEPNVEP